MSDLFTNLQHKLAAGIRVTDEEALALFQSRDLLAVGELAAYANRLRNDDRVFFNVNRHINYTNLCVNRCTFCAFSREAEDEGCYTLALNDILAKAAEAAAAGATEIHMVGGLHPDLPFDFYLEMLAALKADLPQLHLKAFTAVEIDYFARLTGQSVDTVIAELRGAGLDSMPGGGAEIFAEPVRKRIARAKVTADGWLEVHRTAHELGIPTNATMLYGHVETREDRLDHMIRLRELQDDAPGFYSFVPLAFQPDNNPLARELGTRFTTGLDDLRNLAVSRLMLDNVPHIKGYWIMITPELTQVTLSAGVSDIDGTIKDERIAHASGAVTEAGMTAEELVQLVKDAGRVPVRRDALYNELEVYA